MSRIKKSIFVFISIILLLNMSSETVFAKKKGYTVDTSPGQIIYISLNDVQEKMDNGETFTVTFSTTTCLYCKHFHDIFDEYIKTHHVIMYEVVLDNEPLDAKENRKIIQANFSEFDTTPGVFYVKNGKEKSYLNFRKQGLRKKTITKWIRKYKLDKK